MAASRSHQSKFTWPLWHTQRDSNLSRRGRQGFPPGCSSMPPPETSHRHNTAATDTHPTQARLPDHAGLTRTIPASPQPPAQGQAYSRCSIRVCRMDESINQKTGPGACAHPATYPSGPRGPQTTLHLGEHRLQLLANASPWARCFTSQASVSPSVKRSDNT